MNKKSKWILITLWILNFFIGIWSLAEGLITDRTGCIDRLFKPEIFLVIAYPLGFFLFFAGPILLLFLAVDNQKVRNFVRTMLLILLTIFALPGTIAFINEKLDFSHSFPETGTIIGLTDPQAIKVFVDFPGGGSNIIRLTPADYSSLRAKDPFPKLSITVLEVKKGFLGLKWRSGDDYLLGKSKE